MAIKLTGGGSNKVVHPSIRTSERGSKGINPGRVSQVGVSLGNHITEGGARKLNPVTPAYTQTPNFAPKFGNEVALNSKSAPGQGRTIHERGTQGTHGPVASGNPPPEGQIFPGFPGRRS
jgi:hypothetical protein